jgi:penicillin amidase
MTGGTNLNDVAPTIYNKWIYFLFKKILLDRLGTEGLSTFLRLTS